MSRFILAVITLCALPQLGWGQAQYLIQSTARSVRIEAIATATNAFVTTITGQNFSFALVKEDGTETTWVPTASGGTHDCTPLTYALNCELPAADLDQLGHLHLSWIGSATYPGWKEYTVIASASYDVNVAGNVTDGSAIESDLSDIQGRLPAALGANGNIKADIRDYNGTAGLFHSGTSDSGTTTTMVDAARTEADTDYWAGAFIRFTSGNIAGQVRKITAFTPGSDTITFQPATTQAVSTQSYEIIPAARADLIDDAITAAKIAADSIGASELATDAIGAAELAADAIGASELATDAIGAAELAANSITASEIADGAIDAGAIATDAITAAKIAADAVGADEIAADAITAAEVADNTIDAGALAANAITAAKVAADVTTEITAGLVLVAGTIGSTGNDTTHLHLTGLTYGDDEINSYLMVIRDVSASEYHSRWITDWADAGDLATVATLPFTPENAVDTYWILPVRSDVTGGSGLDAAGVRAAVGLASPNLDTQLATIDTNVDSILDDTGTSGVALANNALTNAKIANDAITANKLASDVATEIQTGLRTLPKNTAYSNFAVTFFETTGVRKTDLTAGQISCNVFLDGGAANPVDDTTETELSDLDAPGVWVFDLTAAETNGDNGVVVCKTTGGLVVQANFQTQH